MNAARGDPSAQDEQMNASYAANRYARLDGMGAVAVPNAVGAPGAINGVAGVTDAVPQVTSRATPHFAAAMPAGTHADGSAELTQAAYWETLQGYLRPGDVLFTDNGTSYATDRRESP